MADGMDVEFDRPFRSRHRKIRDLRVEPLGCGRATDAGAVGRSVGGRIRQRAPRHDSGEIAGGARPPEAVVLTWCENDVGCDDREKKAAACVVQRSYLKDSWTRAR